jgi:hypothetical protein
VVTAFEVGTKEQALTQTRLFYRLLTRWLLALSMQDLPRCMQEQGTMTLI